MPKLVDADKLKEHYAWWDNEDKKIFDTIVDLQPTVDAVPIEDYKSMEQTVNKLTKAIADAEPVVRCKDCKWHYILNGHNRCDLLDLEARDIRLDWFCADGERKEDAET